MKHIIFAASFLVPSILAAQSEANLASTAPVKRSIEGTLPVTSSATATAAVASKAATAPILDGKLDDAAWQDAQTIDKFLEYEPNKGADSRFKTDVRVVHDDKYLYVMAR